MTKCQLRWSVVGMTLLALVAYWPLPYVDVRPLFEQSVPQQRPERPPHPIEIYRPPDR